MEKKRDIEILVLSDNHLTEDYTSKQLFKMLMEEFTSPEVF
jgi:hypothetical protein